MYFRNRKNVFFRCLRLSCATSCTSQPCCSHFLVTHCVFFAHSAHPAQLASTSHLYLTVHFRKKYRQGPAAPNGSVSTSSESPCVFWQALSSNLSIGAQIVIDSDSNCRRVRHLQSWSCTSSSIIRGVWHICGLWMSKIRGQRRERGIQKWCVDHQKIAGFVRESKCWEYLDECQCSGSSSAHQCVASAVQRSTLLFLNGVHVWCCHPRIHHFGSRVNERGFDTWRFVVVVVLLLCCCFVVVLLLCGCCVVLLLLCRYYCCCCCVVVVVVVVIVVVLLLLFCCCVVWWLCVCCVVVLLCCCKSRCCCVVVLLLL